MRRPMTVSDSIVIAADARALYDAVSDPRHMPRWSNENLGAELDDATETAHVGMTFTGENRRGRLHWWTRCVVTSADPGERFAFDVDAVRFVGPTLPVKIAAWEYRFEPVDGGTKVTETWTDRRTWAPDALTRLTDPIATGRKSFAEYQRGNIAKTLTNLRTDFESQG
jgi:uncharacterized protein YndB with AHSA1/START domain